MMDTWREKRDRSREEDGRALGGRQREGMERRDVRENKARLKMEKERENNRTARSQEGVLQQAGSAVCMAPLYGGL